MNLKIANDSLIKNPFWEFSIDFYDHPGIKDILLIIQDRYNLDIIILLMCIWLTKTNIEDALVKNILLSSIKITSELQSNIIYNIRKSRRGLKSSFKDIKLRSYDLENYIESARDKLKSIEIELEALQVFLIYTNLKNNFNISMYKEDYSSNNVENSVQNIETYLRIKNIELFKEIKENLRERISSYFLVKGKKEGEEL
ncbi:MAG: hypothetical protein CBC47_07135 [Alphaproteobacteria bacterium TMED87]|nr:hypothetical protein [Rhodospirillaceae bacterium]OUV08624.1 MAG: hypothetical protein CBC47_07135 [Alphaproteobacteria bacterium TMED87]